MRNPPRSVGGWGTTVLATCVAAAFPPAVSTLEAQLRPVEGMNWHAFDDEHGSAFVGVAGFRDQPASLLGAEGRLVEIGLLGATYRSGRIVLSFSGSAYRIFDIGEPFADPISVVDAGLDPGRRTDSGDYRLSTAVRLTAPAARWKAAFRFGVRLPTTDDRVGLERDQTDFFTTVAGRYVSGDLGVEAELGAAINGVAGSRFDQTDPILYGAGITYRTRGFVPSIRLTGQYDTRTNGPPRGNEQLSELMLGLRSLGATWVHADVVYGLADFSPEWGVQVRIGRSF